MSSARRDRLDPTATGWVLLALPMMWWSSAGCVADLPARPRVAPAPIPMQDAPETAVVSAPKPPLSAEGLGFEPGSEVIRGEASSAMARLAASIGTEDAGPLVRVTVTVDPDPRLCSGVTLARSRAEALRDALTARGVPARRISIEASTGSSTTCHAVGATRASIRVAFIE